jgi:phospholipid/cholesterol/gamma-HCH transport system substrate-binding protein
VLVGFVVALAVVLGVLGTLWLVRGGLTSGYPLYARFPWGAGLKQGQPVRLAGVQVGYVNDVQLIPDGTLIVTMRIQDEYHVPEGSTASVVAEGIFGDQSIALSPERGPQQRFIAEGDTVPTGRGSPTTAELLARVDSVGRNVSDVAQRFQIELVQNGGIADLRQTLASTNRLVTQLTSIAAEQSRQLTLTMGTLRRSASALDSAAIDSTVRNLQMTSANITALTGTLQQTTTRLNGVLAKVDSGSGSLPMLLNDPGLYKDMRHLVSSLDSLSTDFKQNPKKFINLRIF